MARTRGTAAPLTESVHATETQRLRLPTNGPHDADALGAEVVVAPGTLDFGAVRLPVPDEGAVEVEPTTAGRIQAVHVTVPEGRLSVSALAAPRTGGLWPDLAAEIHTSLREGGARVRSFSGEWGRELHATTDGATSVFVGVDGARWMLYGVATGPTRDAVALDARLRRMLRGTIVMRGREPYPVRTVLPLTTPAHLGGVAEQGTSTPPTMTLRTRAATGGADVDAMTSAGTSSQRGGEPTSGSATGHTSVRGARPAAAVNGSRGLTGTNGAGATAAAARNGGASARGTTGAGAAAAAAGATAAGATRNGAVPTVMKRAGALRRSAGGGAARTGAVRPGAPASGTAGGAAERNGATTSRVARSAPQQPTETGPAAANGATAHGAATNGAAAHGAAANGAAANGAAANGAGWGGSPRSAAAASDRARTDGPRRGERVNGAAWTGAAWTGATTNGAAARSAPGADELRNGTPRRGAPTSSAPTDSPAQNGAVHHHAAADAIWPSGAATNGSTAFHGRSTGAPSRGRSDGPSTPGGSTAYGGTAIDPPTNGRARPHVDPEDDQGPGGAAPENGEPRAGRRRSEASPITPAHHRTWNNGVLSTAFGSSDHAQGQRRDGLVTPYAAGGSDAASDGAAPAARHEASYEAAAESGGGLAGAFHRSTSPSAPREAVPMAWSYETGRRAAAVPPVEPADQIVAAPIAPRRRADAAAGWDPLVDPLPDGFDPLPATDPLPAVSGPQAYHHDEPRPTVPPFGAWGSIFSSPPSSAAGAMPDYAHPSPTAPSVGPRHGRQAADAALPTGRHGTGSAHHREEPSSHPGTYDAPTRHAASDQAPPNRHAAPTAPPRVPPTQWAWPKEQAQSRPSADAPTGRRATERDAAAAWSAAELLDGGRPGAGRRHRRAAAPDRPAAGQDTGRHHRP